MRKQWYDYDITELNESMFDETCETSGFKDDDMGDAPDTTMDDSEDGFEDAPDNSGFNESDDYIDSDWYDGKVEPSTIPQHKAEDDAYKNDPSKADTTAMVRKDDDGTETVTAESFFDDINDDLF